MTRDRAYAEGRTAGMIARHDVTETRHTPEAEAARLCAVYRFPIMTPRDEAEVERSYWLGYRRGLRGEVVA